MKSVILHTVYTAVDYSETKGPSSPPKKDPNQGRKLGNLGDCLVVRAFIAFHFQVLLEAMSFSSYCKRKVNLNVKSSKQSSNHA